jgi:hypothetical protein
MPPSLRVRSSKESNAPRLLPVVTVEVVDVVAVEVTAVLTALVVIALRVIVLVVTVLRVTALRVTAPRVTVLVAMASVVAVVADQEPPLLKAKRLPQVNNALNAEDTEIDTRANPVKMLIPSIARTVPDVDSVETAREELPRAPGVITRSPRESHLLKVRLLRERTARK